MPHPGNVELPDDMNPLLRSSSCVIPILGWAAAALVGVGLRLLDLTDGYPPVTTTRPSSASVRDCGVTGFQASSINGNQLISFVASGASVRNPTPARTHQTLFLGISEVVCTLPKPGGGGEGVRQQ